MVNDIRTLTLAAAGAIIFSTAGHAASDPSGVWFDPDRRGAVEISPCASGNGYCGYVVHIADAKNAKRCGMQILGNVTAGGGGWIYSPDRGRKYTVEVKRLNDDQLRVVGNAGSFFSKTFTWTRAPDDLARCDGGTMASKATSSATPTTAVAVEAPSQSASSEDAAPLTTGATSASLALLGKPMKRSADPAPVAKTAAVAPRPAPVQAAASTVARAPSPAPVEETFEAAPERTCKFKIPYVGRVIDVPCRDR